MDNWTDQPMDVGVHPCWKCGEPVGLFSPFAVDKHLDDGTLEALCERIPV